MKHLPSGVTAYRRTPSFDETSIPDALTKDHQTKPGVWAVITVESGELRYDITESGESHVLCPGTPGVIEPAVLHRVMPLGKTTFFVEFYR